jgi:hypothetical protein
MTNNYDSVAISVGQSTYFTSNETIEDASRPHNPYNLPQDLFNLLLIQRFVSRVHVTMDQHTRTDQERPALMHFLQQDLRTLESQLENKMTGETSSRM